MQIITMLAILAVIAFAFWIYSTYVYIIFVRETMELSTLKAVIAYLLPWIGVMILGGIVATMIWYWVSPMTSAMPVSGTGFGSSASSSNIALCKSAALTCEESIVIGIYFDSSECLPICTSSCTTSSGNEVIENAIEYCMQGKANLIK